MRTELENIEHIEQYLEGKLSETEINEFEKLMDADPQFKADVDLQKQLVDRIEKQALANLISEKHTEHTGRSFSVKKWILPSLAVLAIGTGVFLLSYLDNDEPKLNSPVAVDKPIVVTEDEKTFADRNVTFNEYTFLAEEGTKITDPRSGAVIKIKPNILTDSDGNLVSGQVKLNYREFRDQADIALSNIPMDYHDETGDYQFNSAGMFEIRAEQKGQALGIKSGATVNVEFEMVHDEPGIGFYAFDDKGGDWKFIRSLDAAKFDPESELAGDELEVPADSAQWVEAPLVARNLNEEPAEVPELAEFSIKNKTNLKKRFAMLLDEYAGGEAVETQELVFDNTTFDQRFQKADYLGLTHKDSLEKTYDFNELTGPISLQRIKSGNKRQFNVPFKLVDTSGTFSEVAALNDQGITFISEGKKFESLGSNKYAKSFFDVRIRRSNTKEFDRNDSRRKRDLIEIIVKDANGDMISTFCRPKYNGMSKRKSRKQIGKLIQSYNQDLKERGGNFARSLIKNVKTKDQLTPEVLRNMSDLLMDFDDYKKNLGRDSKIVTADMEKRADSLRNLLANTDDTLALINKLVDRRNADIAAENKRNKDQFDQFNAQIAQLDSLPRDVAWGIPARQRVQVPVVNRWRPRTRGATLLASGMDPGHTYPKLVRSLNCASFGVYNCDQIYVVGRTIVVKPEFYDENDKPIRDGKIISMIDLKFNGAFSFDPNRQMNLNPKSDNVILLFGKGNKLYMIGKDELSAVKLKSWPSRTKLKMKNVSAKIKSPADLKRILNEMKKS